jgi:hypothetical protein
MCVGPSLKVSYIERTNFDEASCGQRAIRIAIANMVARCMMEPQIARFERALDVDDPTRWVCLSPPMTVAIIAIKDYPAHWQIKRTAQLVEPGSLRRGWIRGVDVLGDTVQRLDAIAWETERNHKPPSLRAVLHRLEGGEHVALELYEVRIVRLWRADAQEDIPFLDGPLHFLRQDLARCHVMRVIPAIYSFVGQALIDKSRIGYGRRLCG